MAKSFDFDLFIKGGVFSEQTKLEGLLAKPLSIVYGRNGSGKSTIARAFREQQPDRQAINPVRQFELSTDGGDSLSPEVQNHLFVFNEDFIDDNIKVKDGLKSIIRIGASAELDAPIQEAKDKIQEYKEQQKPIQAELDILNGSPAVAGSINEADKQFKEGLRKDGGYADRLYKMEGKRNLVASVLNPVLNYDKNDTLPDSIGKTAKQLGESIDRFLSFKSGSSISWQAPVISHLPDLVAINTVLAQKIRPAELTAEEQLILDELSNELASENFIPKTENLIIRSARGFCPLCHQPVSTDYKHTLEQRLVKFRDKAVQDFKAKVIELSQDVPTFNFALPSFPTSDYDDNLATAVTRLQELNSFLSEIKTALEKKAWNPFSEMDGFDHNMLDSLASECQAALSRIEEDVAAYNQVFKEKDSLKKEISQLNIRLAYHENKTWIDAFNARSARREQLNQEYIDLNGKIDEQTRLIGSLSAQIDQVDDARAQINHYLDIIFGTNKLRLAPAGKDKYKLQVKQGDTYRDIPPKAVSSGERNALALAYFFACVLEKKDQNYNYGDHTLLVIDDPVSSFDAENKAGVLSLLSNQIKKVLNGNSESKVLVFTHDFTTLRALCDQRSHMFPDDKNQVFIRIRTDHKLSKVSCSHILENMEYYNDLQEIFNFANFRDPEDFDAYDAMGNAVRSFAESYATRMFKCKWHDLFTDDRRLKDVPEDIQENLKAFAIRPVLNSESHGVFASFEPVEVQRAARALLIYMYYASHEHLYAYLVGGRKDNEWKIETIEKWVDEL